MNRKALFTIFLVVFTEVIGIGIVIPIMPVIVSSWKLSSLQTSLLLSAYSIAQFPAAPVLGYLSDIYGRKPLLLISKLGTVLAYIIFAFSPNFAWLLFSRLLDGFTGGNISIARAFISDITTPQNRSRGMAIIGVSFGLGFVFGPLLGSLVFTLPNGRLIAGLLGASICFLSYILTIIFLPETISQTKSISLSSLKKSIKLPKLKPNLYTVVAITFLFMLASSAYQSTFSFFTSSVFSYTPAQNGQLLAFLGLISLLVQGNLVRVKFKQIISPMKIGMILSSVGILLTAFSSNLPVLLISLVIYNIGNAIAGILLPTLASLQSDDDPEGEVQGMLESVGALARILGPAIAGYFITSIPRQITAYTSLINLLPLVIFAFYQNRLKEFSINQNKS